jgi:hypothetical protein
VLPSTLSRSRSVIPSAVISPHGQRAHGLPQDLYDQMRRVLARQPLPEPSLPRQATGDEVLGGGSSYEPASPTGAAANEKTA